MKETLNFVLLGLVVYRLSILIGLADKSPRVHKLRKLSAIFMSPADLSIGFSVVVVSTDYFLHDNLLFKLGVLVLALSGFACVLASPSSVLVSRMMSNPQPPRVPAQP